MMRIIIALEATNTGPGFNRGSGGGTRGCGFEERVGAYLLGNALFTATGPAQPSFVAGHSATLAAALPFSLGYVLDDCVIMKIDPEVRRGVKPMGRATRCSFFYRSKNFLRAKKRPFRQRVARVPWDNTADVRSVEPSASAHPPGTGDTRRTSCPSRLSAGSVSPAGRRDILTEPAVISPVPLQMPPGSLACNSSCGLERLKSPGLKEPPKTRAAGRGAAPAQFDWTAGRKSQ